MQAYYKNVVYCIELRIRRYYIRLHFGDLTNSDNQIVVRSSQSRNDVK